MLLFLKKDDVHMHSIADWQFHLKRVYGSLLLKTGKDKSRRKRGEAQ
jgi:hypothetical protein